MCPFPRPACSRLGSNPPTHSTLPFAAQRPVLPPPCDVPAGRTGRPGRLSPGWQRRRACRRSCTSAAAARGAAHRAAGSGGRRHGAGVWLACHHGCSTRRMGAWVHCAGRRGGSGRERCGGHQSPVHRPRARRANASVQGASVVGMLCTSGCRRMCPGGALLRPHSRLHSRRAAPVRVRRRSQTPPRTCCRWADPLHAQRQAYHAVPRFQGARAAHHAAAARL